MDPNLPQRQGLAIVGLAVALVASAATWMWFSVEGPDLRPTCSGRPPPDPPFGPNCWNGPRELFSTDAFLPALVVFVTVLVVLYLGWRLTTGRRSPG